MKKKFSDSATFKAFQNGDEHAYKIIFYELFDAMVLFSFRIIRDVKQAEDIFVEAFFKLCGTAAIKNDYQHFRSELYKVVRFRSYDYYNRTLNRIVPIDEEQLSEPSEDPVADWTLQLDVIKTVLREIKRLPPKQQKLAKYLFLQKLTVEQVADIVGVDEKTVRNQKAIISNKFIEAFKKCGLIKFILF